MNTWKKRLAVVIAVGSIGGAVVGMAACGESKVPYTIVLTDQDGNAVVDAEISLLQGETEIATGTTDADGKFSGEALAGEYVVDVGTLPYGYLPEDDMVTVTISKETATIELVATNNVPNGTLSRPFIFDEYSNGRMEIALPAGETQYYTVRAGNRKLVIESENVEVVYNGTTYAPESGKIEVAFLQSEGTFSQDIFAVVNKSGALQNVTLAMVSPLGSMENPILIETLSEEITATVTGTDTVYYTWTATGSGELTISSVSTNNYLYMYNENTYVVTEWKANSVKIAVNEGDVISIQIAVAGTPAETAVNEIVFTLSFAAAA